MKKEKEMGFSLKNQEKKKYSSPILEVMIVEMECGIAANSAAISPVSVNGNIDQVQTDWIGNSDITIDKPSDNL